MQRKEKNTMIPAANYDYHAVRANPGIKGMTAAANNPANRTVFQHYIEKQLCEEKKVENGTKAPYECNIPYAVLNIFSEPSETDAMAVLDGLRERFGIQINTMGTYGLPALDEGNRYDGSDSRTLSISVGLLYKMASDPETHRNITDKIQRWMDGSSEFLGKHGGAATNMTMSITEYSEIYSYGENFNVSDEERTMAKKAWEELIDYLLKWLDERNEGYDVEKLSEYMFEIINTPNATYPG